jgi:hypothetical protein
MGYFKNLILLFSIILFNDCSSPQTDSEIPKRNMTPLLPTLYDSNKCLDPVENMLCVSGGVTKHQNKDVVIDTFYIDQNEATNQSYEECIKAKGCKSLTHYSKKEFKDFTKKNQPVVGLTYQMAHEYCRWNGKRVPTELEWNYAYEKFHTGRENPDCSIANLNGCNSTTLEVASFPSANGIYDMEGNAPEWVNEWVGDCKGTCKEESCPNICYKNTIPCSGRFPCEKLDEKIVKGGGFFLPLEGPITESKKSFKINSNEKITVRCVSDTPYLTNSPGWIIKNPIPDPVELPGDITPAQYDVFHKLSEVDTLDKPFCDKPFTSPAHCRDPVSYIKPNEARNYLFAPYIKNLWGGYVGVAADANYTFISYAKSEWVWLMDFDFVIINLHRTIRIFVINSPTVKEFLEKWNPINKKASLDLMEKEYGQLEEWPTMKKVFEKNQSSLYEHYKQNSIPDRLNGAFGWLRNPDNYKYIRHLYLKNRISIHGGDLLKDKSLYSIGQSARKLGVPIRILYPSNAEEFWKFNENFKRSIINLPFDEASVVLRTVHEYPWHVNDRKGGASGFWHYVVHGAYNYQKKLLFPEYFMMDHFKNERIIPTDMQDFSTIDLPSNIPFDPTKKK